MWVRGLKQFPFCISLSAFWSHPMWVRGLKHRTSGRACRFETSHPMWVRGLKLGLQLGKLQKSCVAPHVGAWIETEDGAPHVQNRRVAPHVGAWIETAVLR